VRLALAVCVGLLLVPATALADLPVISYVDETGVFRLYEAEFNREVAPPPAVPVADPATFRYGISLSGRYIVFTDAAKKLHLLDRATNTEVPLPPAVDIYASPGSLSVSDTGLIAFDNAGAGGAVVFNGASGQFVETGLPSLNNGHRQTHLSADGRFVASTCDDTAATCVDPLGSGSDVYVQDLTTRTDTGFSQNGSLDEQRPCIDGDGSLVGIDKGAGAGLSDVHVFDRTTPQELTFTGLNDASKDDTTCVLDRTGAYIGLTQDTSGTPKFAVYQVASSDFLPLPADKEFDSSSQFSEAYTPPPGGGPPAPPPSGDRVKPVTSSVRMTRLRFRPGRRATAFRFVLSEPAAVRIVIRRMGRYVGELRRARLNAGANTIRWNGRLKGRKARPGEYAAVLIATDLAGNLSLPVFKEFRVLRPAGDRRP
jgi:hypothetical protein